MALIQIKDVSVNSQVMLAPMAGVTDIVFRALVRRWAPESLICTEMISSNGIVISKQRKARILDRTEKDQPIAYQLAANKPEILIQAAQQVIEDHDPETIDLNMGCPVKKITGNFEGCALMRDPSHAASLVEALVKEIDKPVTVKFRLGWDSDSKNYREFGQAMEAAGASMVTMHSRTRAQGYKPGCDWDAFGILKQAVSIPVVANGDINSPEDARYVIDTYGVDGVMIGRGCQGKPWMIGEIDTYLKTGQLPEEWSLEDRLAVAYEHAENLCDYRSLKIGIKEIRKHLAWYVQGFRGARRFRGRLMTVESLDDIQRVFEDILRQQVPVAS